MKVFVPGQNKLVSRELYDQMLDEEQCARLHGTPWQLRGPPGVETPDDGAPSTWRGQRYRPMSGKWANRGGANKGHFNWKYGYGKSKYAKDAQVAQAKKIAERVGLHVSEDAGASSSSWQGASSSSGW